MKKLGLGSGGTVKMFVIRIVGLVLLAGVVAFGGVDVGGSDGTSTDSAVMKEFKGDFSVSKSGVLTAHEELFFDFPEAKHGIFRFFDTRDQNNAKGQLLPYDISVKRDGFDEPYKVEKENRGRYRDLKIGDAGRTISGPHTYDITYKIKGVLAKGRNGLPTQFNWNVIGSGWKNTIEKFDLTVNLPTAPQGGKCFIGNGTSDPCTLDVQGDTLHAQYPAAADLTATPGSSSLAPLDPNTPVTIGANLDMKTPAQDNLPWSSKIEPVLGSSVGLLGGIVLLALLAGALGVYLSISVGEKKPPYPLMYGPPDGIGPAQAAYILNEVVDNKAFIATMMYAAEKGVVTLDQKDKSWTLTGTDKTAVWAQLDQVTAETGTGLGVTTAGGAFQADPKSVSSGLALKTALDSFNSNTTGWAKTSGLMVNSGLGGFGAIVLLVAAGLAVFLGVFNPLNLSAVALIPGLFAIGGLGVGVSGAGTKRTSAGRDLWSRVGGFYRILSTPSAENRFDFSGRKELYTSFLPWAVAFDCADAWAEKYKIETAEEPPTPSYFPYYAGWTAANMVNNMVDSFDSTVSSAISSYEATQSSSSGGGGGFSGGGGSGGGGGGSW